MSSRLDGGIGERLCIGLQAAAADRQQLLQDFERACRIARCFGLVSGRAGSLACRSGRRRHARAGRRAAAGQGARHRVQLLGRERGPVRGRTLPAGQGAGRAVGRVARMADGLLHADTPRHVDQSRQDAFARQELVHRPGPFAVVLHHLVVEGAIQHQLRIQRQLQTGGGLLQHLAETMGAQRQRIRVVGGCPGQHAETLAQHEDLRIAALLVPARDFAQHDFLVHHRVFDQGQRLVVQAQRRCGLRCRPRRADASQLGFQAEHVVRDQLGPVLLQGTQVDEDLGLQMVAACLLGLLEQLLLELHQHRVQRGDEVGRDMVVQVLQHAAHARRQGRRRDGGRRGSGRRRSCAGHRCSGLPCSRIIITPAVAGASICRPGGAMGVNGPGTVRSRRW